MKQLATKCVLNLSLLKVLGQSFHIEAAADPLVGKLVNDQGNWDAEPLLPAKQKRIRSYGPMDKDPFNFDYVDQPH